MNSIPDRHRKHNLEAKRKISRLTGAAEPAYLHLDLFMVVWLFVFGCMLGLGLETLFHFITYGNWESRAGLIWGPFSPIYGVGAVLLTLSLNRVYYSHNLVVFITAMIIGSVLEFSASWMMETFWGAIAWDYTGTFGNINGRTNFIFGMMWGALGLVWVRFAMPAIKFCTKHLPTKSTVYRVISMIVTIVMTADVVITVLALNREGTRKSGIPPVSPIEEALDRQFDDEWMEARFQNMTILGNGEIDHVQPTENTQLLPTMERSEA